MKFLPLLWATLWRKRARTILTLLSLVAAFLLLGLLQGASALFQGAGVNLSAPILITQSRVSFTSPLPLSILPRIEAVPGVTSVSYSQFFGGIYQDPKNFFPQFAVVPDRWLSTFKECALGPGQAEAWKASRTAAVAGEQLVKRFGWKIGDQIPLVSQIWPQKNGSRAWSFELVGIVGDVTEDSCPRKGNMYMRYDYLDEARQFGKGLAGLFVVRIDNPEHAERVGQTIDTMFENSPEETKTQSEKDFALNFGRQIGNVGLILNMIMLAVFFSILMLTGNTMRQAVQDRIPELAVLKTIGFSDLAVTALVLAESLLMCLLGGLAGMALASVVMDVLGRSLQNLPPMHADARLWAIGVAAMAGLAVLIGAAPAWQARRLSIVDALAGR
ncbi:MAG TPA: FtsX-like permease family protein [Solimonas sp.]|nr:FtsX-like permease family protein [Solimonas sp.]